MMLSVRRHLFPLAVGTIAVVFLGLFFLLPLLKVFGASILDVAGKDFTLSNYVNVLSNRFFLNGLANSLSIAAAASVFAVLVGVPFAFCLARLPIGGKPARTRESTTRALARAASIPMASAAPMVVQICLPPAGRLATKPE